MKRSLLSVSLFVVACGGTSPPAARSVTLAPPPVDTSTKSHRAFPATPTRPIQRNGWAFAPQPLAGPYGSIDDYCRAAAHPPREDDVREECGFPDGEPAEDPVELTATTPYEGARLVFTHRLDEAGPVVWCSVAIRTSGGWYVDREPIDCRSAFEGSTTVSKKRFAVEDFVMGGASELVFRYATHRVLETIDKAPNGGKRYGAYVRDEEDVIVCGLGPTRWPSCTPPIPVVCEDTGISARVGIRWSSIEPGMVAAKADGDVEDCGGDASVLLGSHAVIFP